ncbi:rCG41993 [Rattus norvegicus]|uniref:RCG41993 n=1 Tax=Rattus norvegicus TaxID=10116 RepID=A6JUQ3_RAT|nr:rCG41993 [Rattus norvegicus]
MTCPANLALHGFWRPIILGSKSRPSCLCDKCFFHSWLRKGPALCFRWKSTSGFEYLKKDLGSRSLSREFTGSSCRETIHFESCPFEPQLGPSQAILGAVCVCSFSESQVLTHYFASS